MTQTLTSSVPAVFSALLGLVQTAAAAQNPAPDVFSFELGQYEPGSYITVHEIRGPRYEWESIGVFSQKEIYDIGGVATVYVGDSVTSDTSVPLSVLTQTYALFQTCVMTPVMSNRTMPLLGTAGTSPYLMLPAEIEYTGAPGSIGGNPAGWAGVLTWSFHFEAVLTPA